MPGGADAFAGLVARARGGDREAMARLVGEYEPKVRLVARTLLGPALRPYLDSLDLVQSVHRSLLLGLRHDKFDIATPEDLLALAVTLVRRKVARQWRRLRRRAAGAAETTDLAAVLTSLSNPGDDPARAAEFDDQVRQLCSQLSEVEGRLLDLRLRGHRLAEIAADLGLSDVALRVRLTRLRQRLRASGVFDDWL